ncbi:hypothetical protein JWG44_17515 [Leptospira sp. 201903071]|uniref:hypothetical protein n=1 Tax=Leptospira ainazelensis TaxID=2810034 RepID=UPI001965F42A|nr:hypothetical protein [Leptospira ainazelensis]MBM9502058.1 hypothetical protein [Leptospira ainazelensis]
MDLRELIHSKVSPGRRMRAVIVIVAISFLIILVDLIGRSDWIQDLRAKVELYDLTQRKIEFCKTSFLITDESRYTFHSSVLKSFPETTFQNLEKVEGLDSKTIDSFLTCLEAQFVNVMSLSSDQRVYSAETKLSSFVCDRFFCSEEQKFSPTRRSFLAELCKLEQGKCEEWKENLHSFQKGNGREYKVSSSVAYLYLNDYYNYDNWIVKLWNAILNSSNLFRVLWNDIFLFALIGAFVVCILASIILLLGFLKLIFSFLFGEHGILDLDLMFIEWINTSIKKIAGGDTEISKYFQIVSLLLAIGVGGYRINEGVSQTDQEHTKLNNDARLFEVQRKLYLEHRFLLGCRSFLSDKNSSIVDKLYDKIVFTNDSYNDSRELFQNGAEFAKDLKEIQEPEIAKDLKESGVHLANGECSVNALRASFQKLRTIIEYENNVLNLKVNVDSQNDKNGNILKGTIRKGLEGANKIAEEG